MEGPVDNDSLVGVIRSFHPIVYSRFPSRSIGTDPLYFDCILSRLDRPVAVSVELSVWKSTLNRFTVNKRLKNLEKHFPLHTRRGTRTDWAELRMWKEPQWGETRRAYKRAAKETDTKNPHPADVQKATQMLHRHRRDEDKLFPL